MAKALFGHVVAPAELRSPRRSSPAGRCASWSSELDELRAAAGRRHRRTSCSPGRRRTPSPRSRKARRAPVWHLGAVQPRAFGRAGPRDGSAPESRAPQEPDAEGLQVLRVRDDPALRAGHHLRGRGRTVRASPTSSTPSPGCSASRARRRCAAARWRTSSSPAPPAAPPLGRAEVTLTIDNTDGALPIDYTEVSITRRMFRSGESEYEINGDRAGCSTSRSCCRDSGIGREMHVIVGQGQLDAVLPGRPEDRRGLHRGGRRRPQAPQAQGEGAPQARRDAGQPQPADRPHRRAAPPAQAAGPAGRGGPAGRRRAGRPARRPAAAAGRRPRRAARRPGRRGRRRDARSGHRRAMVEAGARRSLARARPSSRRRCAADAPRAGHAPRRPGTGCPRWLSASAAPRRSPPSGPAPRRRRAGGRPAAIRSRWRPRPPGSPRPRRELAAALAAERGRLAEAVAERPSWSARWPTAERRWSPPPGRSPTGARAGPAGRRGRRRALPRRAGEAEIARLAARGGRGRRAGRGRRRRLAAGATGRRSGRRRGEPDDAHEDAVAAHAAAAAARSRS